MFGYVTINDRELSKPERARFLSLYCGVCEDLKAACGTRGRFTLSNDSAFLALVLCSLYEPEEKRRRFTCGVHPMTRRECAQSEITAYAADMNLILSYYSCLDDWQDEGRRIKKMGAELLKTAYESCAKRRPDKARFVETELGNLSKLEKAHCADIDCLAGCFGRLLGEVFAYRQDEWEAQLRTAGDRLGRFIYIMDAWEDAEKDRKNGAFNALSSIRREPDYEQRVFDMLTTEISLCAEALEALPLVQDINIIRNVIYSGVWTKYSIKRKPAAGEGDK